MTLSELEIEKFIEQHKAVIESVKSGLAMNFDKPAQRIINAGFTQMEVCRFDSSGNDLWQVIVCFENGWDYEKPPAHLVNRWSRA